MEGSAESVGAEPVVDAVQSPPNCYSTLPRDVLLGIFMRLDSISLYRVGQVCSKWRKVALEEELWENIFCNLGAEASAVVGQSYRQGCLASELWWVGRPISILPIGGEAATKEFVEMVKFLGAVSGFIIADHHDDGEVGLAIVLACCDDGIDAEMSAAAGRLRKGRHTAIYCHGSTVDGAGKLGQALRNMVASAGARCITVGKGSALEDFVAWNKKLWHYLEKKRGWGIVRQGYVQGRVATPLDLHYYKLNRSVILTTSHVPRRLSVRGERLYFPYVMPLLVAVIAIVYCFIWPYVQAYLYTTLTGSKMAGTKLR